MISDADRRLVDSFAAECADALGAELKSVLLYGEAVSSAAAVSSPATLLVVGVLAPVSLRKLAALAERWRKRGIPTPLVLDDEYLATSCDVFPLEILTLIDSHVLVRGDSNPLATLVLDDEHLRLEVEQQLKGKILHLRQHYLEISNDARALCDLILDSSEGFETIMRGLLKIAQRPRGSSAEIVAAVEDVLAIKLTTFKQIQATRGNGRPTMSDPAQLFESYLEELVTLARISESITRR